MSLIKHELYKLFSQRVIYIAMIFLVSIQVLYFFADNNIKVHKPVQAVFHELQHMTPDDKLAWAEQLQAEERKRINDQLPYDKTLEPQIIASYEITRAQGYGIDASYYLQGWSNVLMFNQQLGYYLIGALCIIGLSSIFSREYGSRMDSLIYSSKHGRRRTVSAKLAVTVIYCATVCMLYGAVQLTLSGWFYDLKGSSEPLRAIHHFFAQTSYTGPIWSYYIIQVLFTIAGCSALGLLVTLLSSLTRHAIIPAFIGGTLYLLPDVMMKLNLWIPYVSETIVTLFPYSRFVSQDHLSFVHLVPSYEIAGVPIYNETETLFYIALYISVTCLLVYFSMRKRQVS
ncbi:hypothetical protein [Paenibacillus paeoniae]|uniref:Uncharacterized protein n=1 Tax=Paenibacillus paeoniae TaxID=2292705 RepID=A0A371PME5_9BACL|nr:hypothetical protein [Paenibacillus paeoniae]REK76947.1 hypothetical protein DX130_08025 [Paenibacillus paeoniae]